MVRGVAEAARIGSRPERSAAADMSAYFGAMGKTPPPGVNMAEFALDLVNKDFASAEQVDAILDAWAATGAAQSPTVSEALSPLPAPPRRVGKGRSGCAYALVKPKAGGRQRDFEFANYPAFLVVARG